MNNTAQNYLPQLYTDRTLDEALRIRPNYDKGIRTATESERLLALQEIYHVYIPTKMSREIYTKLYLALHRSLDKKQSLTAIRQFGENQHRTKGGLFTSIIGGADSFTIIGDSGIGKSASVSRAIELISPQQVIELPNRMRIIPCVQVQTPADCSVKGLLLEILRKVDEILETRYHYNASRSGATTDMLIGSVSTVALNHIGSLVVDEVQNVVNSKNGAMVVGTLTQLINNAGISICMVGTPKSALFFEQEMMLARRSLGLSYGPFNYDETFAGFCSELFQYQYVKEVCYLDEGLINWFYDHSLGNASIIVSLIHDAQEIAILNGHEKLDKVSLEEAYKTRMNMLQGYLYREPCRVKAIGTGRKRQMACPPEMTEQKGEHLLITDIILKAKRLQKDLIAELIYNGVQVKEVAI